MLLDPYLSVVSILKAPTIRSINPIALAAAPTTCAIEADGVVLTYPAISLCGIVATESIVVTRHPSVRAITVVNDCTSVAVNEGRSTSALASALPTLACRGPEYGGIE